jgi:hypothetical protein
LILTYRSFAQPTSFELIINRTAALMKRPRIISTPDDV